MVTNVRLDVSTACQLKCPSCPTASGEIGRTIGTGFLKFERFVQFLSSSPQIKSVELSNWGEIFLNPDLLKIMEYSHSVGVSLTAGNGANMNNIDPAVIEGLVKYQFASITCSIDGATQETYGLYRRRGNLANVLENIRQINEYKLRYKSQKPVLTWQFVGFNHNAHEIPAAKEMAASLDMGFYVKLSWDPTNETTGDNPYADLVRAETKSGSVNRAEYAQQTGNTYMAQECCSQLWLQPQINFDGKMLGCATNTWDDYGNVFESGLTAVMESERFEYAKLMLLGKAGPRNDVPCTHCPKYKTMQSTSRYLQLSDILPRPAFVRQVLRSSRHLLRRVLSRLSRFAN